MRNETDRVSDAEMERKIGKGFHYGTLPLPLFDISWSISKEE